MRTLSRPVIRRTLGATASAGLAMTLLAACGTGSTASASSSTGTANSSTGTGTGTGTGAGRTPGVNGQIAAVSGKTLQVQGSSSQTAVTYTASTTVTQVVSATESDLAVGKCVTVSPVASTNTGTTGAAPDLTAPVTASSVSITDPVNGTCMRAGGFGGGHRAGATGAGGGAGTHTAPAGSATGATGAGGFAGGGRGFGGGGVSGTIASISGNTMTVTMTRPAAATGATGSTGTTTTTRTVTLNSATTYTQVEKAADSALTVGKCVSAQGSTDSTTGMLTASSITIRPAVNGSCSTGFGGGRGGFGGGSGGAGASTGIAAVNS